MKLNALAAVIAALAIAGPLTACTSSPGSGSATDQTTAAAGTTTGATSVTNCGAEVTFDEAPQRVTLLKPASVPSLAELELLDKVTAKAGRYPAEYYDSATNAALDQIPSITDKLDAGGHLQISKEEVVATSPDLVTGFTDTVNRETMAGTAGIKMIENPALCGALKGEATWEDVFNDVRLFGAIFDKADKAEEVIGELKDRIAALEKDAADAQPTTVTVLYPTVGDGVTYAYGTGSGSHPVVKSAGLDNVYGDQKDRVFEVTAEDLVAKNPDVILALYSEGEAGPVVDTIKKMTDMDRVTAVRHDAILPLLLNFVEPPTPLAVDGLEKLDQFLKEHR